MVIARTDRAAILSLDEDPRMARTTDTAPRTTRRPDRYLLHKDTTKRHHHRTFEAAETEAGRLLGTMPGETIVITQEVGRVTLKPIDPDAATGCADDQMFSIGGVPQ